MWAQYDARQVPKRMRRSGKAGKSGHEDCLAEQELVASRPTFEHVKVVHAPDGETLLGRGVGAGASSESNEGPPRREGPGTVWARLNRLCTPPLVFSSTPLFGPSKSTVNILVRGQNLMVPSALR